MDLPYEIYHKIFNLLDKDTVRKCVVVCKNWSLPALQVYYKVVTIDGMKSKTLKVLLNQEQYFKHCHWSEQMSIQEDSCYFGKNDSTFTKQAFLKFLEYFPNLTKIVLRVDNNRHQYAKYMCHINTSQYLTRLEDIVFMNDHFDILSYDLRYSIYYHFRSSLTSILLSHRDESTLSSRYGGALNYLSQFKKLTHLTYQNNSNNLHSTVYEIQAACLYLTYIELHDYYNIPSFQVGSNTINRHSNLKELTISFVNLPTDYVENIIENLPSSVESLNITLSGIDLYAWRYQVGIDNVLKLAGLMSKLSGASLRFGAIRQYEPQPKNLHESNLTTFFKVLNAFRGDKNPCCAASFADFNLSEDFMTFSDGKLSISYKLYPDDLYDNSGEEPVFRLPVPDRTVSVTGLEVINCAEFYLFHNFDKELLSKSLNYLSAYFPHLQNVKIDQQIELSRTPYYFCEKEIYDPSSVSKENLKAVRLANSIPPQEFTELLNLNLPDIQNFGFTIGQRRGYHNVHRNQNYIINLTPFKSLQVFYFDVQLVLLGSRALTCYLNFEYEDGEKICYQFNRKEKFQSLFFEKNQTPLISTIIFRCQKIEKFLLYDSEEEDVLEILRGLPQASRRLKKSDSKYMNLS